MGKVAITLFSFLYIPYQIIAQNFCSYAWNCNERYPQAGLCDRIKTHKIKSIIVKSKTTYTGQQEGKDTAYKFLCEERYSKTGKVLYALYPTNASDTHYGITKKEFTYDNNDSLISTNHYFSRIERKNYPPEKFDLPFTEEEKITYSKNKKTVSRFYSDKDKEDKKNKYIYYYDAQGNIIQEMNSSGNATKYKYSNGKVILREGKNWRTEHAYTQTGKPESIKGYVDGKLSDSTYYIYNKTDSLVEKRYWQSNIRWANSVTKYVYDDIGKIRYVKMFSTIGKGTREYLLEAYKYSAKDELIEETFYVYDIPRADTTGIRKKVYSDTGYVEYWYRFDYKKQEQVRSNEYGCFYYNKKGLIVKEEKIYVPLSYPERKENEISYKYDSNNNLIEVYEKQNYGYEIKETITYDSNQLPILVTWSHKSSDGKYSSESYKKYFYEYY